METLSVTAEWLRELREERGLMPEEMPRAMLRAEVDSRNIPCSRTIRRAEQGQPIRLRYRFGLAQFFDVPVTKLWPSERQTCRVG